MEDNLHLSARMKWTELREQWRAQLKPGSLVTFGERREVWKVIDMHPRGARTLGTFMWATDERGLYLMEGPVTLRLPERLPYSRRKT